MVDGAGGDRLADGEVDFVEEGDEQEVQVAPWAGLTGVTTKRLRLLSSILSATTPDGVNCFGVAGVAVGQEIENYLMVREGVAKRKGKGGKQKQEDTDPRHSAAIEAIDLFLLISKERTGHKPAVFSYGRAIKEALAAMDEGWTPEQMKALVEPYFDCLGARNYIFRSGGYHDYLSALQQLNMEHEATPASGVMPKHLC